jgi:hypothetical protein
VTGPAGLAPVFKDYFAGLDEQFFATRPDDIVYDCFGCSRDHPRGLRVRCFKQHFKDLRTGVPGELSDAKIASGLREALQVGAQNTVNLTGRLFGAR